LFFLLLAPACGFAETLRIRVYKDLALPNPLTRQRIKAELESTDRVLFLAKKSQKMDVIAEVDFNNYLKRVILAEIPYSWPDETIKAQIVATRSYTLARLYENKGDLFHLEGSTDDQAFKKNLKKYSSAQIRRIERLIKETGQQVLLDENQQVLKAFYHADCGGHTIEANRIWPEAKNFGTTQDEYCAQREGSKWSYELPLQNFRDLLNKDKETSATLGLVEEIILKRFSLNARVSELSFKQKDSLIAMTGEELRRLVGYNKVKSTQFTVVADSQSLQFRGRGFGHGVGLCQRGAEWLGRQGARAEEILKKYYPMAILKKRSSF